MQEPPTGGICESRSHRLRKSRGSLKNFETTGAIGILVLITVACMHNSTIYSDRAEAGLKGVVQSVQNKGPHFITFTTFDRAGQLTEMTRECIEVAACPGGPCSTRTKIERNGTGKKVVAEEYDANGVLLHREVYSFDNAGHLSARVRALPDGGFIYADFFWYDHRGNKMGEFAALRFGQIKGTRQSEWTSERKEYFYDVFGRGIQRINYDGEGKKITNAIRV